MKSSFVFMNILFPCSHVCWNAGCFCPVFLGRCALHSFLFHAALPLHGPPELCPKALSRISHVLRLLKSDMRQRWSWESVYSTTPPPVLKKGFPHFCMPQSKLIAHQVQGSQMLKTHRCQMFWCLGNPQPGINIGSCLKSRQANQAQF